jgi:hypothetical protein
MVGRPSRTVPVSARTKILDNVQRFSRWKDLRALVENVKGSGCTAALRSNRIPTPFEFVAYNTIVASGSPAPAHDNDPRLTILVNKLESCKAAYYCTSTDVDSTYKMCTKHLTRLLQLLDNNPPLYVLFPIAPACPPLSTKKLVLFDRIPPRITITSCTLTQRNTATSH